MRISGLNFYNPAFMAHSYVVEHKKNSVVIRTDNEKQLGNEPYLVYRNNLGEEHLKMEKDGALNSAKINTLVPDFRYYILYKDTGKVDLKDGEEYQINPKKMMQKVAQVSRVVHRQPTVFAIKEGKTTGKIVCNNIGCGRSDDFTDIDEPVILITPKYSGNVKNPNIVGIIFTAYDSGAFAHITTQLGQRTDVCAAVFEPEIIKNLISMDGQNAELEIKDGNIKIKRTSRKGRAITYPGIDVPKLKPCNKILSSNEYSPDIIGTKAVNLRRLEILKDQGKIDVLIPKSIALPHDYIQKMFDENPLQEKYYNKHKECYVCKERAFIPYNDEYCGERMDNLCEELFDKGIISDVTDPIMVRSSFNGEDLPKYSAAGIYRSMPADIDDIDYFYNSIIKVAQSKWDEEAIFSRKMHNIPDENIQFGVLLQQRINPDYKFTLYTDDDKGNLKIDLYSGKNFLYDNTINPHIFTYNKETGELVYNSIQLENPAGVFNENQELESIDPVENDLSDNKELFEQIKRAAQNAVVVEKEFGHPQDIEGGIKDNKIYFWQTRNIVK